MSTIKKFIAKANLFKRIRDLEKNQSVIISAHNNLNAQFKTLLEHHGLVLAVSKKGKMFLRKNRWKNDKKQDVTKR